MYRFLALLSLFFFNSIALAQDVAQPPLQPPGLGEIITKMLPMFAMVFFIFYFLVLRPQQSKAKEQQTLIGSLKKGDNIVTSSGLVGKFLGLEDDCVLFDAGNSLKLKFEKNHIVRKFDYIKK